MRRKYKVVIFIITFWRRIRYFSKSLRGQKNPPVTPWYWIPAQVSQMLLLWSFLSVVILVLSVHISGTISNKSTKLRLTYQKLLNWPILIVVRSYMLLKQFTLLYISFTGDQLVYSSHLVVCTFCLYMSRL